MVIDSSDDPLIACVPWHHRNLEFLLVVILQLWCPATQVATLISAAQLSNKPTPWSISKLFTCYCLTTCFGLHVTAFMYIAHTRILKLSVSACMCVVQWWNQIRSKYTHTQLISTQFVSVVSSTKLLVTIRVTSGDTSIQPTHPGSLVLISSWSELQRWRSKCQIWAVPSLLPEINRSPWLAHWILSTRSEWASFSSMRWGPSSPTMRYTLRQKWRLVNCSNYKASPRITQQFIHYRHTVLEIFH